MVKEMFVRLRDVLPSKKKQMKLMGLGKDSHKIRPRGIDYRAYSGEPILFEESKQNKESCTKRKSLQIPGTKTPGSCSESEFSDYANSISVLKMHEVRSDSEVSIIEMVKENPKWQEAFIIFDHDGDGFLTEQEFTNAFRSLGLAHTNVQMSLLFKDLVSSREQQIDGVSWDEFKTIIAEETRKAALTSSEKFLKKLKIFQKDGLVDLANVRDLLTGYADKMNHEDVELLLQDFSKHSLEEVRFQPDFVNVFQTRNDPRDDFGNVAVTESVSPQGDP